MKFIIKHFVIAIVACSLWACDCCLTDAIFSVTPSQLSFTVNGGAASFRVSSSYTWEVDPSTIPSWCTLSTLNGTNVVTNIEVVAQANSGSPRTEVLVIKASNGLTATVTLLQAAAAFKIVLPPAFAASYPSISTYPGSRVYHAHDRNIPSKKIAEICLEYIKEFSQETPATVIYPMDPVTGKRTNSGVIANNGGSVVWSVANNSCTYTAGSTGPFTNVYYKISDNTLYFNGIPTLDSASVSAVTYTDRNANSYPVIKIGKQYWIGKNLMTTKYNTAALGGENIQNIPTNLDAASWEANTTGACCFYEDINAQNSSAMYNKGVLYNWFAISNGKLDHEGWKVPSNDEWAFMLSYLTSSAPVINSNNSGVISGTGGSLLKSTVMGTGPNGWISANPANTNVAGLTAISMTYRDFQGGFYSTAQNAQWKRTNWWSTDKRPDSSSYNPLELVYFWAVSEGNSLFSDDIRVNYGMSVRLCKSEL